MPDAGVQLGCSLVGGPGEDILQQRPRYSVHLIDFVSSLI
jgi:hypothetical protein